MTDMLILSAIEEQSRLYPHLTAVEGYGTTLSYGELNSYANQLAHALISAGLTTATAVGVYGDGGPLQVVCLLAAFKAGAVYVPMSPEQAINRLAQVIAETEMDTVITTHMHYASLKALLQAKGEQVGRVIVVDGSVPQQYVIREYRHNIENAPVEYSTENPGLSYNGDNSAYIFYTSGSTGHSKGIIGSHGALSHYIHWHRSEWSVDSSYRISQLAPVTFDASLKDILTALSSGARVCMPESSIKSNPALLVKWLDEHQITMLQTVPSVFRLITSALSDSPYRLPLLRYVESLN